MKLKLKLKFTVPGCGAGHDHQREDECWQVQWLELLWQGYFLARLFFGKGIFCQGYLSRLFSGKGIFWQGYILARLFVNIPIGRYRHFQSSSGRGNHKSPFDRGLIFFFFFNFSLLISNFHFRYRHFHSSSGRGNHKSPFDRGWRKNLVDFMGWRLGGVLRPAQVDWSKQFEVPGSSEADARPLINSYQCV